MKTNAMRILDKLKIPYEVFDYSKSSAISALDVAKFLNEDPRLVFKTLVTYAKSKEHYVFVIPSLGELDLKKASIVTDEKYIEMLPQKELLSLTGYIHGGCSPIGMKKVFPTFLHSSAKTLPYIFISGGKVGLQIKIAPHDLEKVIKLDYRDLII